MTRNYLLKENHFDGTNGNIDYMLNGTKKNMNLLIVKHPDLLTEWDYELNNEKNINVNTITCGSHIKAYWHCSKCNGKYEMVVANKINNGQGCPYCAGKQVLKGYNDLQTKYPELMKEWDWSKNNIKGLKPDGITCGSHKKAYWKCKTYKHEFNMTVKNRANGQGCPFCAGKQVLKGFNDLESNYPDLVNNEWDWIENDKKGIKPDAITCSSSVKACWYCNECNGNYEMMVLDKTSNHQGCPFCAGKQVLKGFNDLESNYPDLVNNEWDWAENDKKGIKPDCITCGANIKTNWHCNTCNGKYEMMVYAKVNGQGCPFCAGKKVLKGYNDLETKYPELMKEWDWAKNNQIGLKPDAITSGSTVKAWWRCSFSHSWKATIKSRTGKNSGCPKCSHRISKQENEVADFISNYLCTHYVNIKYTMYRSIKFKKVYEMLHIDTDSALSDGLQQHLLKELDVYIPELNIAVEYDGDYWHSDEVMMERCGLTNDEAHVIKEALCSQAGIKLLIITEHDWLNDTDNVKNMLTGKLRRSASNVGIL